MNTTRIKVSGIAYTLEPIATDELLRADLLRRGFDGQCYLGRSSRGRAAALFYRAPEGAFTLVVKA